MRLIFLLITLFSFNAHARMFPRGKEPKLKIHELSATGISQADFNDVLDQLQKVYDPIFAAKGKTLYFSRLWSDPTINSDAQWKGSQCFIESYGGFARYPTVTKQMYMLVELHEIGHCVGGAPYFPGENMSVEGQADYYASGVGASTMKFDPTQAQMALAEMLAQLDSEPTPWRPGPKLPAVTTLYVDHPAAQCRLDTYDFSHAGLARPNCWYPGGAPTGVGTPGPSPAPQPQPTPAPPPVPQPQPQPIPIPYPQPPPCGCQPMPYPYPQPFPPPYPTPQPGPPWPP